MKEVSNMVPCKLTNTSEVARGHAWGKMMTVASSMRELLRVMSLMLL